MNKQTFLKFIAFAVLNVFIISSGVASFAAIREPDAEIQWSHINTCGNLFEKVSSTSDYDIFGCGGSTTVAVNKYAYVKVELKYLSNGVWKNFHTWEDKHHMTAAVDETIQVEPGYTYKLVLTHKAYDANDNLLETYNDEADNYLISLPRS